MPEDIHLATPAATLTALAFEPENGDRALLAAWDGTLAIYDCFSPAAGPSTSTSLPRPPLLRLEHPGPLLAACWGPAGSDTVFCAGADRRVRAWHLGRREGVVLGEMDGPVSSLVYSAAHDLLVAGSFHSSLLLLPSPLSQLAALHTTPPSPSRTVLLPAKPLALTMTPQRLVVAMAERLVYVFDLSTLAAGGPGWEEPEQKRESALKGVTRAVEGMPDGLGWTACSVDGRIAVEYFSPADQAKKYAFKAHRLAAKPDAPEGDSLFAINALAHHPSRELFASAGSDGAVSVWDPVARKRAKSWKFKGQVGVCSWAGRAGEWIAVGFGGLEQEGEGSRDGRDIGCIVKWLG